MVKEENVLVVKKIEPNVLTIKYNQEPNDKLYRYGSCLWANFRLDFDSGELIITSDCGNFAYRWAETGKDFLALMLSVDEDYLLRKLSSRDVIDVETTLVQAKDYIKEYCEDNEVDISKFDLNELAYICSSTSSYDKMYDDIESYLDNYDVMTAIEDVDNLIWFDYPPQAKCIVGIFVDLVQPKIPSLLGEKYKKYPITTEMVEEGLKKKIIVPFSDGELKARIGDYWFYFGGSEYESSNPSDLPFDCLVTEIKTCLDFFLEEPSFKDEYFYYYYFLKEHSVD